MAGIPLTRHKIHIIFLLEHFKFTQKEYKTIVGHFCYFSHRNHCVKDITKKIKVPFIVIYIGIFPTWANSDIDPKFVYFFLRVVFIHLDMFDKLLLFLRYEFITLMLKFTINFGYSSVTDCLNRLKPPDFFEITIFFP